MGKRLNLGLENVPVKIDTVVLNLHLINPNDYKNFTKKEMKRLLSHNFDLHRVWDDLQGIYNEFKSAKGMPEELSELGVKTIHADIRRYNYNRYPAIIFECEQGTFKYKLTLMVADRIFLMVSQSLHNTATGTYFEFDADANYSKRLYEMLNNSKRILLAFMDYFELSVDEQWYSNDTWFLKRLDLCKDVNVGAENTIRFFESAGKLDLPGYTREVKKDNYKVEFQPQVKGEFNQFATNLRYDLPTINLYHKSDELKSLVAREMKSMVPEGYLRLEIQFYQGKNRKSMQGNIAEQVYRAVRYGNEFSNELSEKIYREFDILSGNLWIDGYQFEPHEFTLKEKVRRVIYEMGGICRKKDVRHRLGLSGPALKSLDNIFRDMVDGGEMTRKGHSYRYTVDRMNELGKRYKGDA